MKSIISLTRIVTRFVAITLLLGIERTALAANSAPFADPTIAAQGASTPGVGRVVISLLLILGLLLGVAWVMRRVGGLGGGTNHRLRVHSSLSLGARERVVLITIDGREVLLGVAPGNVRTLLIGDPVALQGVESSGTSRSMPSTDRPWQSGANLGANPDMKAAFAAILRRSLGQ